MHSHVILGLWPIAGMTTIGVTERDAMDTLRAAVDSGIHRFDTAFSYGVDGESDRLLGRLVRERPGEVEVIGKVGQRWVGRRRVVDGQPATLIADAETSLTRIGRPAFDCLLLHSPDPNVAIERSVEALAQLQQRQLCRRIGVCNVSVEQLQRVAKVISCDAIQAPLNLMQQQSLATIIPAAHREDIDVFVYWVLMKGLLAGKIGPNHVFDPADPRPGYDIFQGSFRVRAHRVVDGLKQIGQRVGRTVAQLSIGWALSQTGVSAVLAGAHRPNQVAELARSEKLDQELLAEINRLLVEPPSMDH